MLWPKCQWRPSSTTKIKQRLSLAGIVHLSDIFKKSREINVVNVCCLVSCGPLQHYFWSTNAHKGAMEALDCQTHHPHANLQSYRKGLKTESCLGDCALTVRLAPPQLTILFHYRKQVLNWHLKILEPSYAAS